MANNKENNTLQDGSLFESFLPLGTQLTFGTAMGLSSGYALRQFGKVAGIVTGAGFCLVQGLSYLGYIDVNWRNVHRDYTLTLDRDGDGEVTAKDLQLIFNDVADVLKFNMPAGTGFTMGLAYGISGNLRMAGAMGGVYGVGGAVVRGAVATGFPALMVAAKDEIELQSGYKLRIPGFEVVDQGDITPSTIQTTKKEEDSPEKRIQDIHRILLQTISGRDISELRTIEAEIKDGNMFELEEDEEDLKKLLLNQVEEAKKVEKLKMQLR